MNILITGSNGFIGSHLVEKLLTAGHRIKCLVRPTSNLKWIRELPVEFVFGDVTDFNSLLTVVAEIESIYHLGGIVRAKHKNDFFHVNVEGTNSLLEACRQRNPSLQRFLYVSSQAAAGPSINGIPLTENIPPQPISAYGRSKLLAEKVVLEYQKFFPVTIIRPPVVYGPRDDDMLQAFKYVKWGLKPVLGTQEKKISIIYIRDLVQGICIAGEHPAAENELFFLADAKGYSWIEMEDAIAQAINKKAISIHVPEVILDIAAIFSEQIARIFKRTAIINRDKALEMKQDYWLVDSSRAEKKLNFTPQTSLAQGIKETYDWYRFQQWL